MAPKWSPGRNRQTTSERIMAVLDRGHAFTRAQLAAMLDLKIDTLSAPLRLLLEHGRIEKLTDDERLTRYRRVTRVLEIHPSPIPIDPPCPPDVAPDRDLP